MKMVHIFLIQSNFYENAFKFYEAKSNFYENIGTKLLIYINFFKVKSSLVVYNNL